MFIQLPPGTVVTLTQVRIAIPKESDYDDRDDDRDDELIDQDDGLLRFFYS